MSDIYTDNMSRNAKESQRLDGQSTLFNRNLGYLLHPSISDKLSDSFTIADVGTGTGLFLLQLAKIHPRANFYGFDISRELFPAPEDLPHNVKLDVMDLKKPPPSEMHNRFDVVHARLLVAAMNPTDWDPAVRNLTRLLKPGGALQWDEGNLLGTQYLRGRTDSTVFAARFMASQFIEALKERFSSGWNTLPQIMRDQGFTGVSEDIVSSDRLAETREAATINGQAAIFTWAKLMSERGVSGSMHMDELIKLEDQADRDVKSGCYARYDIHVTLGFKPK